VSAWVKRQVINPSPYCTWRTELSAGVVVIFPVMASLEMVFHLYMKKAVPACIKSYNVNLWILRKWKMKMLYCLLVVALLHIFDFVFICFYISLFCHIHCPVCQLQVSCHSISELRGRTVPNLRKTSGNYWYFTRFFIVDKLL